MEGYLEKSKEGWIVVFDTISEYLSFDGKLPLRPYDIRFENDKKTIFESFYDGKEVDFEVVKLINDEDGKECLYAKLIDKPYNTDEIYVNTLAESVYGKGVKEDYEEGFVDGYNKAKETLYTKEQLMEVIELARLIDYNGSNDYYMSEDEIIKALKP
ncbi:MAG: hypothetical protein ACOVNU_09915 [Candidatus Kapaibacteriota bacterium]